MPNVILYENDRYTLSFERAKNGRAPRTYALIFTEKYDFTRDDCCVVDASRVLKLEFSHDDELASVIANVQVDYDFA